VSGVVADNDALCASADGASLVHTQSQRDRERYALERRQFSSCHRQCAGYSLERGLG